MRVQLPIRSAVVAALLLAATAGCAGDEPEPSTGATAASAAPTAEPTTGAEPSAPSEAAAAPSAQAGSVPLLEGVVGSAEDPESFDLVLTDSSGAPVEELPGGDYDIRVQDLATIHNFHLTGPGVDETTPIPGTGEVVWRVTLTPGEYTAVCDPHPDMRASFTVT